MISQRLQRQPAFQFIFRRCQRQACSLQYLLQLPPPLHRPRPHKALQKAVEVEKTIISELLYPRWHQESYVF